MAENIRIISKMEYWVLILILIFATFIMALPLLGAFYILGDIGGGKEMASWGVSFFVVGNIITKPAGRVLMQKYGNYRVLKISLFLTILMVIPLLFTQDYNVYLVFRYLGGLFSGPIFSIVTSICTIHRPDHESHLLMLIITIILTTAITSSIIGAAVAYENLWRAAYIGVYAVGLILFALICILSKGYESPVTSDPIDWVGMITFCISFTGLGFCFITGQLIDGFRSLAFNIVLTLSSCLLLFFFIWNAMHKHPLLPIRHFKKIKFSISIFQLTAMYVFYNASSLLLNYWLVLYANYTIKWLGYLFALDLIGPIVALYVFRYRTTKINPWVIAFAVGMFCCFSFGAGHLSVQVNLFRIAIIKIGMGIAFSLHIPMVINNIRECFTEKEFGEGWVFFVMFRLIGVLVGVAYFAILWERRAAFYHWRLGGELTLFSQNTLEVLKTLSFFHFTPLMKEEGLNIALDRQARALAINDCFFLITTLIFVVFILSVISALYQKKLNEQTLPKPA